MFRDVLPVCQDMVGASKSRAGKAAAFVAASLLVVVFVSWWLLNREDA